MDTQQATTRMQTLENYLPLEAEGIRLRPLHGSDAERYSMGESDPQTLRWAHTKESDVSVEAMRQRIEVQFPEDAANGFAVRLAIASEDSDEYLGLMAFFDDQDDSVEIGFVITPDARGQGVAKRALAATEELARTAGYSLLRARTDVDNIAARRTLESAGYSPVGEPEPPVTKGLDGVLLQRFEKQLGALTDQEALQQKVTDLLEKTGIPGAQVTIISGDRDPVTAYGGVLNVETGLDVTGDSIFQIGSITKLFTTFLVLQLVDEGVVNLEDPVIKHVPEFKLKDPETTAKVRVIDLLQHRGGFDGDYFTDGGRGTDAPLALIKDLETSETFLDPGQGFAYSNAGMVVLGRLVELKRGTDYLTAVEERIYEPVGMDQAVTLPEEAILHSVAVGHTRDGDGNPVVMPSWMLPMSALATGAALTMSTESLAKFGEVLLNEGRTRDGRQLLNPELAKLMGERQFGLPVASPAGDGFAVGGFTFEYDGAQAFGHDGQTVGQVAGLRVLPEADLVIAMATNRENTTTFTEGIIDFALHRFANASLPAADDLPTSPLAADAQLVEGFYSNNTMTATVTVDDGEAHLELGARGIDLGKQPPMRLHRIGEDVYRVNAEEHGVELNFKFIDSDEDGVADFLWFNRMLRRET